MAKQNCLEIVSRNIVIIGNGGRGREKVEERAAFRRRNFSSKFRVPHNDMPSNPYLEHGPTPCLKQRNKLMTLLMGNMSVHRTKQ